MKKYLMMMIISGLIELSLVLYLSFWRETFWNFVENKNLYGFVVYLVIFTIVALVLCIISAFSSYMGNRAAIEWRKILNNNTQKLPVGVKIENVNQRIQEDCMLYPELYIKIGGGLIQAICYIIVFSITLYMKFKLIYLLLIIIYAILSTLIAKKIGTPLISLNYRSQQTEATYRNSLTDGNFKECISIQLSLAQKLKRLNYFQSLYGQLGVVIPLIIIAPSYFSSAMLLGSLMQANNLMSTIVDNLSYGINNFDVLNRFLSCRKRLQEINIL